jgi:hypothetical protein
MKLVNKRISELVNGGARPVFIWLTCLLLVAASMVLTDAQIGNSVSANKPLMIGSTNEQPLNANFWKSNAVAISAAIGGGGGGGSDMYTTNFTTNGTGQIDLTGTPKQLTTNNAAGLTNLQAPQLIGTLPLATLPSAVLTNNFPGIVTLLSSLAVNGAINCLATVNGAAAAVTAGISGGSLNIASNAAVGGALTVSGTNMALVNPGGSSVVLSLVGQGAGGGSNSISTSPAGLLLNSPAYVVVTAPNGEIASGPLTIQNNATVNTNLTVGGTGTFGGTLTVNGAAALNGGLTAVGPVFSGTATYTNGPNANGVQMHIGANSGALAIRGAPAGANSNSLSVESGIGAQFIQDWSVITASSSNVVANLDTNANLTLKNGGKLYGSLPATNIDASMGQWTLTNCYHDCQYATNGSMLNGGTNLFGGPFSSGDAGKEVDLGYGASQAGGLITSYQNSSTVGVNFTAGATVTNLFLAWGHDDSATINSQITNAFSNNCRTIVGQPGLYMLNTWTTLPYSAGYAAIVVPFTNCDLVTNGEQTLKIMGTQTPAALAALNGAFPEPLATNGLIFCCPANPPSGVAACVIGVPEPPTIMSLGFDGVKLILQDVTMRMAPNPGCTAINGHYLAGLELHGSVVVDSGTATPYASAPSVTTAYGIWFPTYNNYGKIMVDFAYVEGFYTGFYVNEHLSASYLFEECCHTGAQFGLSYHANWIGRLLCQGTAYPLYNPGVSNETYIGELDVEEDEGIISGLNFVNTLYDPNSGERGGVGIVNCEIAANKWGPVTNSVGCANFNMPNFIPGLTQNNVAQYSSLTVTSNALVVQNGVASSATNSVGAITATAWGNTNGLNGFVWLSGASNLCFFDAQSNLVKGPFSITNLGYPLPFPICAGGGLTNSGISFTFHAE